MKISSIIIGRCNRIYLICIVIIFLLSFNNFSTFAVVEKDNISESEIVSRGGNSSEPELLWWNTFGGSDPEVGHSILETSNGDFIICGSNYIASGDRAIWLINISSSGEEHWNRTINPGIYIDRGFSIQQATDGGYIIVGTTQTEHYFTDVLLLKTDEYGNEEWRRTFGGNASDQGDKVFNTEDGGYIITGHTTSFGSGGIHPERGWLTDLWLIKTDSLGNEQWNQTYGVNTRRRSCEILITDDGGYMILLTKYYQDYFNSDIMLIKTDMNGTEQWNQTFNKRNLDLAGSFIKNNEGGYTIVGSTYNWSYDQFDIFMIKTDLSGNLIWNKTIGNKNDERGSGFFLTGDGDFVIVGSPNNYTKVGSGYEDIMLIGTDGNGTELWRKTFGGFYSDIFLGLTKTSNGDFVIIGNTNSYGEGRGDILILKYGYGKTSDKKNQLPLCSITFPSPDAPLWDNVTISGIAESYGGRIEKVEIRIEFGPWQLAEGTTNWSFEWNTRTSWNGFHSIFARSFDGQNYSSNSIIGVNIYNEKKHHNVVEDDDKNKPPVCSIDNRYENDLLSGPILISGSAMDPDGSVLFVEIQIGWDDWVRVNGTSNWTYTWNPAPSDIRKTYKINSRAFDGELYSDYRDSTIFITVEEIQEEENEGRAKKASDEYPYRGIAIIIIIVFLIVVFGIVLAVYKALNPTAQRKPDDEHSEESGDNRTL